MLLAVGAAARAAEPLRVGSEIGLPPYADVDGDGHAVGFSVDLFNAVARVLGLPVEYRVSPWDQAWEGLLAGRLDALPMVARLEEREGLVEYSQTHSLGYDAFFGRKDERRLARIEDARPHRILVMRGDAAHHALVGHGFQQQLVFVDQLPEAMRRLAAGHEDAVLAPLVQGSRILRQLGLTDLIEAGPPLKEYQREYSFAVRKGDTALRERLDQGLQIVQASGEYQRIYDRWLGIYDRPAFPMRYLAWGGAALGALLLLFLAWNWLLRRSREQLRQREERLSLALNATNDVVWDWDIPKDALGWNGVGALVFGWTDPVERPQTRAWWLERVHPDDRARVAEALRRTLADRERFHWQDQYSFQRADGSYALVYDRAYLLRDGKGRAVRLIGAMSATTALVASERTFRRLSEASPSGIWQADAWGHYTYVSPRWTQIAGLSAAEARDAGWTRALHPEDRVRVLQEWLMATQGTDESFRSEFRFQHEGGQTVWVLALATAEGVHDGHAAGWIGTVTDISEHKAAEESLRLSATVFSHAREGIMITDASGRIMDVNETFTRLTGYTRDEVLGQTPRLLHSGRHGRAFYATMWQDLAVKGYWFGEIWNRRKGGELYLEMLTISAVRDEAGRTRNYVALFSDITAQKEQQARLERSAYYDALTQLPNRLLLADRLYQAMARALRHGRRLAVIYLDLDGFKAINDRYGHEVGDQLLVDIAHRMRQTLRDEDTMARLGGDEFVAVLVDLADQESCYPLLTRLLAAAAEPARVGEQTLQVSASLGVTFYPQAEEADADLLLRQADQAMYQAKLAGRNRYHVFDEAHDRSIRGRYESLDRIRQALRRREFGLYFQPKVNMRTGQVAGVEALLRWVHPILGVLHPDEFLPIIEDHPLMLELGEWVLDAALAQLDAWGPGGLELGVSVNVAALHLQQKDFMERLSTLLALHPGVRSGCLELEILETSTLRDLVQVSQVITACREIGIEVALDDFGTGYSSLSYLKRLPANRLKIDRSFVRDMLVDLDDLAILEGVIGLASAFQRQVIAEGVETIEHGVLLLQLGCELAQGYAIARPMRAEEVPGWVSQWRPDAAWLNRCPVSRDQIPLLHAGVEHRAWIAAIEAYLSGQSSTPPPLAHNRCRFGAWLVLQDDLRRLAPQVFQDIERQHRAIHALAQELVDRRRETDAEPPAARLAELRQRREQLLEGIRGLVQAGPSP